MEIKFSGHFSSGQALINWNPSLVRVEDQLNNLCFLKHFFFQQCYIDSAWDTSCIKRKQPPSHTFATT